MLPHEGSTRRIEWAVLVLAVRSSDEALFPQPPAGHVGVVIANAVESR
jgi:hypothetical protein